MNCEVMRCTMPAFSVIGKKGSSNEGEEFVSKLWEDANSHFCEVESLALKDEKGSILGVWGLMSDFSMSFLPWEDNFTKGYYLAGVQVDNDSVAPEGWEKWMAPAFEYLYVKVEGSYQETLGYVRGYMKEQQLSLVGAIFDYNCPEEAGQLYLFFPIKRLN